MGLNCGIIGISNSGKTTVFNCMAKTKAQTSDHAFATNKTNIEVVKVPDSRLLFLAQLYPTGKIVNANINIVDIPGLTKGSNRGEGVGNKFLADIRNADALIHVLRCFDDENLPHIEGRIDPVRDIETIDIELQIKDIETVSKKTERMEKLVKVGDKEAKQVLEVLKYVKAHLENMQNVRTANLTEADKTHIKDLNLLSAKPVLYMCNIDEKSIHKSNKYVEAVKEEFKDSNTKIITIAAALESEIAEFSDENEKKEFLNDYGLKEPGVNVLIREAYDLLDLQSFFTMGTKENRAWTIKKGTNVWEAAGAIHSDMQRGFIRAEVIKFEDIKELGSETAVKNAGKLKVEGKNYIVQEGDIIYVRFNV